MRLSLECGRLDWWNIPDEMDLQRLAEWEAFDVLECVGAIRDDVRTAHQTASLLAAQGIETAITDHLYDVDSVDSETAKKEEVDTLSLVCAAFGVVPPARSYHGKK